MIEQTNIENVINTSLAPGQGRHGVIVIDNSNSISKDYMFQGNINSNKWLKNWGKRNSVIVIIIDSRVIVLVIVKYNLNVEVIVIVINMFIASRKTF